MFNDVPSSNISANGYFESRGISFTCNTDNGQYVGFRDFELVDLDFNKRPKSVIFEPEANLVLGISDNLWCATDEFHSRLVKYHHGTCLPIFETEEAGVFLIKLVYFGTDRRITDMLYTESESESDKPLLDFLFGSYLAFCSYKME